MRPRAAGAAGAAGGRWAAAALALGLLGGCAGAAAPAAQRTRPPTPLAFRGLEQAVAALARSAHGLDGRAVRAGTPGVIGAGIAQLKAPLPHDLARPDVPRYLEGRQAFGRALQRLAAALEAGAEAPLLEAARALPAALGAWIDTYLGLPPEVAL